MNNPLTLDALDTKIFQKFDNDETIFSEDFANTKRVLQYNLISKVYIVISYDVITQLNTIICITKKPSVAIRNYNMIF
jgi:hypothetical protein